GGRLYSRRGAPRVREQSHGADDGHRQSQRDTIKNIQPFAIMLLVLDNYDSFTYNLVQYFGELGADLVVKRNDEVTVEEIAAMHPERICISPGPCTPKEAGISNEVIRHFGESTPLLGVCLGHQ